MTSSLRREVLGLFKQLHRTRAVVFKNDEAALETVKKKINQEYKKNKDVTGHEEIEKLMKLSREVDTILRKNVVQATEKESGVYELHLRPENERLENVSYEGPTVGAEELKKHRTKCCEEKPNALTSKG